MKKVFTLILILLFAVLIYTAYTYTTIRKGNKFYFMKKNRPTFDEVYVDVTDWTFKDYAIHPEISAFLIASGVRGKYIKIKPDIMKEIEKKKKEMEKMIEKEEK